MYLSLYLVFKGYLVIGYKLKFEPKFEVEEGSDTPNNIQREVVSSLVVETSEDHL